VKSLRRNGRRGQQGRISGRLEIQSRGGPGVRSDACARVLQLMEWATKRTMEISLTAQGGLPRTCVREIQGDSGEGSTNGVCGRGPEPTKRSWRTRGKNWMSF